MHRSLRILGFTALLVPGFAFAEQPAPAAADKPASAPAAAKPWAPKPKKPVLPVKISVIASSPDPPWILTIENTSGVSIRVPADERLLSFELKPKPKSAVIQCKVPAAMAPKEFDASRELFLNPGETVTIAIDPRLYCFGSSIDKLIPGAVLTPTFGFPQFSQSKDALAAQGLDRPNAYEPVRRIKGDAFTLPEIVLSTAKTDEKKAGGDGMSSNEAKSPPSGPPTPEGSAHEGEHDGDGPHEHHAHDPKQPLADQNAPLLDLFVSERVDAHAGRDVVLTLRAVNEGQRKLATVLRNRMLQIRVESLRPDNKPRDVTVCPSQHAAHGVASEHVSTLGANGESRLSLLVAEACPVGTLNRPGLYRIRAELDSSVEGESLKADPWLAGALARQSALVRIATGRSPFHAGAASAGPVKLEPPAGVNDNVLAPEPEEHAHDHDAHDHD